MKTDSRLCKPSGDLTIFEAAEFNMRHSYW